MKTPFELFMETIPKNPEIPGRVWTDGTEILCLTEDDAKAIADTVEILYDVDAHIGYYDPREDENENCVDDHTGWWYVDFD